MFFLRKRASRSYSYTQGLSSSYTNNGCLTSGPSATPNPASPAVQDGQSDRTRDRRRGRSSSLAEIVESRFLFSKNPIHGPLASVNAGGRPGTGPQALTNLEHGGRLDHEKFGGLAIDAEVKRSLKASQ
jgi:hypothetical protein